MKKSQKLLHAIFTIGAVFGLMALFAPAPVYASHVCAPGTVNAGKPIPHTGSADSIAHFCDQQLSETEEDAALEDLSGSVETDCNDPNLRPGNCGIISYINIAINVLTAVVGVVIVIMIAVGGIEYSAARDNPQASAAAKGKIYNAVLALLIYLFTFAFLQYLVPGGVF